MLSIVLMRTRLPRNEGPSSRRLDYSPSGIPRAIASAPSGEHFLEKSITLHRFGRFIPDGQGVLIGSKDLVRKASFCPSGELRTQNGVDMSLAQAT